MKTFVCVSLASILACVTALASSDVSGRWASAPVYLIIKQDGNKLSGTGGPTETQQMVTFDNGTVEGDRVTFHVGSMQFNLQVNGDEMRGEMKNGADSNPVFLKRVTDRPSGPRAFEVASVKRASPPPAGRINSSMRLDPGRLTCTNVTLKKLMIEAYGVKDFQVSGPEWLNSELYDITATLPAGTTGDDVRLMVQTLLADRFKVVFHRESKEQPVYDLVVGKAGSKLQEVEFGRGSTSGSPGHFTAERIAIRNLTEFLSRQTGRPVLDMTGLTKFYNFTLNYTPEAAPSVPSPETPIPESAVGPSLFTAVQEQLGLKLEPRKAPVEILVVDRAEKVPTEN